MLVHVSTLTWDGAEEEEEEAPTYFIHPLPLPLPPFAPWQKGKGWDERGSNMGEECKKYSSISRSKKKKCSLIGFSSCDVYGLLSEIN